MFNRLFTRYEANRCLPLISRIVDDIQETERGMVQARLFGKLGRPLFRELQQKHQDLHQELEDLGCYYASANGRQGHVEFPADEGERESYFCWQPGEAEVTRLRLSKDGVPPLPGQAAATERNPTPKPVRSRFLRRAPEA